MEYKPATVKPNGSSPPCPAEPSSLFKRTGFQLNQLLGAQELGQRDGVEKKIELVIRKPQEIYLPAYKMPQPRLAALGFPSSRPQA